MKAVDLVTIEKMIPIFKEGVEANAIEVARVIDSNENSIQYDIVVGKGLYEIGEKAIYVQPDYTIPMNYLFLEYHAPFGDPHKSRLGKKGRVRAIKFNLNFEGSSDPIYSYGVLLPFKTFSEWLVTEMGTPNFPKDIAIPLKKAYNSFELGLMTAAELVKQFDFSNPDFPYQEILGIEKYVADDSIDGSQHSGMEKGDFPSFLYKTDEETIQNHRKEVDGCHERGEILSFTQKRDGSSITEFFRINPIEKTEQIGICSRKYEKKLDQRYTAAYKDGEIILHPYFHPERKLKGWFNDETRTFYTKEEAEQTFEPVIEIQKDSWIDTDTKFGYLNKLVEYCRKYNVTLCLRGELIGAGNKGSGNKLNSDAKVESKVVWFGVDDLSSGVSKRIHYGLEHNLEKFCDEVEFEYTKELFCGVFTYEDIITKAHEYFKMMEETTGVIPEGCVIRTKYSNNLSVKYINPRYDSKL